jgi:hypothetical protein
MTHINEKARRDSPHLRDRVLPADNRAKTQYSYLTVISCTDRIALFKLTDRLPIIKVGNLLQCHNQRIIQNTELNSQNIPVY